ncbi:MAG: pectinesterase family protein [Candidatus Coproplasma sp.]
MKNIRRKSIIAVGFTALSALALGVGALALGNTKQSGTGFLGTYDLSAYAATDVNKITVAGKEVKITQTATFISTDDAYTLCLTVVDMADFGEGFATPLQVGYKIAEGGKYYNGTEVGLSGTVYSSISFANGDKIKATDLTLGFKDPYFVVAEATTSSVKLATPDCIVAAQSGFEVVDEHMDHVYLLNQSLDTANLVVNSLWSYTVGEEVKTVGKKLSASEYSIGETDMTTAGEKTVSVTYGDYGAQTVGISVLESAPTVAGGKVSVNVSATYSGVNGGLKDGVNTFRSVKDAVDFYENSGLESGVYKIIKVGEGTYEDKITTALENLVLIGEGDDKSVMTYSAVESTVDPVTGEEYGLKCATLHVTGDYFKAYNMTIRNDFDYINNATKYTSPQGVALTIDGDGAVIYNTHLYGNQDTLYLKSGRSYFYQSQIDGNVDFIFGNTTGLAYFEECTVMAISRTEAAYGTTQNGYVTAAKHTAATKPDYGYIFDNCTLTDDGKVADGAMALGRPWGNAATVAYINCSFSAAYSTSAYDGTGTDRWCAMSGNLPTDAEFCEYGSKGEGAISSAVEGGSILTAEEAANYTKANLFAATNGLQTSTKFNWELEFSKLEILAGIKEGDLPADTTVTINLKDATLPNGNCVSTINERYSGILTWTGTGSFELAKPENGVKVGTDTVITFGIEGEVTVKAGYYLASSDYKITYKNGMATVKIVAITGQYGDFIGSFVIDTSVIPEHVHEYGGEWTVVTAPTESAEGTATRDCVDCEEATPATQEVILPVLSEENYTITASANEGKSTYTYNSEIYGEITFEADTLAGLHVHSYGDWVVTATLESAGTATKTCTAEGVCEAPTVVVDLPALTSEKYVITGNTATLEAGGTGTYTYTDEISGEVVTFTAETAALVIKTIDEITTITFGSSGNYNTYIANTTLYVEGTNSTLIRDNGGNNSQINNCTVITLKIANGGKIAISSYSGYTNYTVKINGEDYNEGAAETGTSWEYTATADSVIQLISGSNNYFYSVTVTFGLTEISSAMTFVCTDGVDSTSYIEFNGVTSHNNGEYWNLGKNGTITIKVAAGAKITLSCGYWGYGITINDVVLGTIKDGTLTNGTPIVYTSSEGGDIVIGCVEDAANVSYLQSISVSFE